MIKLKCVRKDVDSFALRSVRDYAGDSVRWSVKWSVKDSVHTNGSIRSYIFFSVKNRTKSLKFPPK